MKLTKTVGAISMLGLYALSNPASAADDANNEPRWYGGGSIGQSRAKIHDGRITSELAGRGLTTNSIEHDDRDVGFKLFGARKLNRNFAVEAGYFNLGKMGFTAHTTPTYIARPPIRGVGCTWTSRSRGCATAPTRLASTRTQPVAK